MLISYKRVSLTLAALFTIAIVIYYPALNGGFYHDDLPNLVFNEKVQIDSLSIESIKEAATSSSSGTLKRPISMGTFGLNYYFFGDSPLSFKLTNVFLHAITATLILFISYHLRSLTSTNKSANTHFIIAVFVSYIWLVHPLHVSTVAYIVQRMAILSTLFSLLAILFYLIGRTRIISDAKNASKYFFFCLIAILLGIYSKENAILTPIFILLIEAIIFFPRTNSEKFKKYAGISISIFAAATFITILIFQSDIYEFLSQWYYTTREFTLSERLYTQARIIIYYIKWLFFPDIHELGLFHDDIPLSSSLTSPITTLLSIIALSLIVGLAIKIRRNFPLISLGIGWFFIGHLLESTIIPLEMIYEHRNYLPSVGLIIAAIDIANRIFHRLKKLKKYSIVIAASIIVIFSVVTLTRASQWSDPLSFAYFEAQHHPNSLRANHSLGLEYKGLVEAGELQYKDDAYLYLGKASQLGKRRLYSEIALLRLSIHLNESARPEWIDKMAYKLATPVLRLDDLLILKELTICKNDECLLPKDAALILLKATKSNPRLNLDNRIHAKYHSIMATYLLQRGNDIDLAESNLKKAIEINPEEIQYYVDYINLLIAINRPADAIKYIETAKKKNRIYQNIPVLDQLNKTLIEALPANHSNYKPE